MSKIDSVEILGEECTPKFGKYKNGQIGVFFYSKRGEPVLKATVNLNIPLEKDVILVKDSDSFTYLLKSGIVDGLFQKVKYGFNDSCTAYICHLKINPEDYPEYQLG